MSEIDKRNKLSEEPFAYQLMKNGKVAVSYRGKQIKIVKDKEAERLLAKINAVENNMTEVQLLLAKNYGNFRHRNEKLGKNKRKLINPIFMLVINIPVNWIRPII